MRIQTAINLPRSINAISQKLGIGALIMERGPQMSSCAESKVSPILAEGTIGTMISATPTEFSMRVEFKYYLNSCRVADLS